MKRLVAQATAAAVVLTLLVCIIPSGFRATGAQRRPHPNVIIILADDQPAGTMGVMPRTRARIFDKGTVFSRAYVTTPLCCPSRATLLTGGFPHTTGVYKNGPPHGGFGTFHEAGDERRTMAYHLDEVYETGLFGKFLNGYGPYVRENLRPRYIPPGWDEWQAFYEGNGLYYDYSLNVNGRIVRYGHQPRDYSTDVLGDRFLDWLDVADGDGRARGEPFFAIFAPYAPHAPSDASAIHHDTTRSLPYPIVSTPAVNERDVSDKPTYIRRQRQFSPYELQVIRWQQVLQARSLFSLDRQIGRVMKYLKRSGHLRDTLVIYTSDNGYSWGEHRWWYKLAPYEASIRVPLAMRYEPLDGPGTRHRHDLVSNADIFPTVMSLTLGAAWAAPDPVDGRSLVPALGGSPSRFRRPILLENLYFRRQELGGPVPTYCGIVTVRWRYVVYDDTSRDPALVRGRFEQELYDRRRDPHELTDVSPSRPDIVRRLRARLKTMCRPPPPSWDAW